MRILSSVFILLAGFTVIGCADRPLIYTGTQLSVLHLQGVKEQVPEKLSLGYDRTEYVWLPEGDESSVKGAFDAEYRNFSGMAISDFLVTGKAASNEESAQNERTGLGQSQIISTNSRFNLGLELAGSDGAGPSFNAGFKRSILALFPSVNKDPASSPGGELPSTYTDLSIHTSGLSKKLPAPQGIDSARHLKSSNGVRVVQTIATGRAAEILSEKERKSINDRIRAGLGAQ